MFADFYSSHLPNTAVLTHFWCALGSTCFQDWIKQMHSVPFSGGLDFHICSTSGGYNGDNFFLKWFVDAKIPFLKILFLQNFTANHVILALPYGPYRNPISSISRVVDYSKLHLLINFDLLNPCHWWRHNIPRIIPYWAQFLFLSWN